MNDNLGNMLSKIKNASLVKHEIVIVPYTISNYSILKVLQQENFIEHIQIITKNSIKSRKNQRYIKVYLKYKGQSKKSFITNISRISKPSLRLYVNSKNIPLLFNGLGLIIISTSKGIMTGRDAYKLGIGGELLFSIW
jgi:small subunit ribosomal protein S8